MRLAAILPVFPLIAALAFGQAAPSPNPATPMPKDPAAMLAAAEPLYDFAAPTLKPWHFKVSYQLFDTEGKTSQPGIYEYWWAGPGNYRQTWSRAGSEVTDWHVGGKLLRSGPGLALNYFERKLPLLLLHPVPGAGELKPASTHYELQQKSFGAVKMNCVTASPVITEEDSFQNGKMVGADPTYCFDLDRPMLRISYQLGAVAVTYNKVAKVQGMFLAQELNVSAGKRHILTASVSGVSGLTAGGSELTPDADAKPVDPGTELEVASRDANELLKKHDKPFLPLDAQREGVLGVAVLAVEIGADGHVQQITPIDGPMPSLVQSAISAVKGYEYTPFLLNGKPVPIRTIVYVSFEAGH